MMVSNSTKARVEGTPRGLWLRSSVGWSGARSWVSRHPTRSFMQYNLHLSRMFELRRGPPQGQGIWLEPGDKGWHMKFASDRPYSAPEKAAHKRLEIANSVEAVQDGRIYIELINGPFLYRDRGTPDEYKAGLDLAIRTRLAACTRA